MCTAIDPEEDMTLTVPPAMISTVIRRTLPARLPAAWNAAPVDRRNGRQAAPRLTLAAALVLSLAALGPASAAERRVVKSLLEMRRESVVVQDYDLSCAAAALATLLAYQHGDPVSEREVAKGLIHREDYLADPELVQTRGGFSLLDLKRYVDQRGYEGAGYGGLEFKDLVDLGPVMVPVSFNGYNHFVVFRGVVGDRVLLADPGWGNRTMSIERFERSWIEYPEFGKAGFVVTRRDGTEPLNRLTPRSDDLLTPPGVVLRQALAFTQR
jgi:predicted double-glycine peptidase